MHQCVGAQKRYRAWGIGLVAWVTAAQVSAQSTGGPNWQAVDAAIGHAGTMQPGGVYKYNLPRSDLHVMIEGIAIKPALALNSWVAFLPMSNHAAMHADVMVMGDLVLTGDEIAPTMIALQAGGVEQTAVHHHVLHEAPRVFYMHIHAIGDPVRIAQAIHAALAKTGTPLMMPAAGASKRVNTNAHAAPFDLDTAAVRATLGYAGKVNGGVYQVSVPRAHAIREHGMDIPPTMGTVTALNFQPTGSGKAAITGDFVLIAAEVNPVIRALTHHGITVTALHNHMLTEEPRLFFMHFWANADAVTLAQGLRAALDRTASQSHR